MSRTVFNRMLKLMAGVWPDRAPTAETTAAYWLALSDLHDSTFEAAVLACLKDFTFYPKPAEIRAKATQLLTKTGALPAEGEQAWATVLRTRQEWHPDLGWIGVHPHYPALGRIGERPCPLPELLAWAVEAVGGMGRIWNANDHELGFVRKEFLEFYGWKRESELRYTPELLSQPLPESRPKLAEAREEATA